MAKKGKGMSKNRDRAGKEPKSNKADKNHDNKTPKSGTITNNPQDTSGTILSLGTRAAIDSIDADLIQILLKNGRLSNVDIASALNTSEATVRRRIQTLKDRGFIRGFSALLDYKRFGQIIKAHLFFKVNKKYLDKLAKKLTELENSCTVYRVIGDYNLTTTMVFKNIAELQEFIDHFSELDNMEKLDYLLVTGAYKPCPLTGI